MVHVLLGPALCTRQLQRMYYTTPPYALSPLGMQSGIANFNTIEYNPSRCELVVPSAWAKQLLIL